VSTVYIVGAGASAAANAPLISDFKSRAELLTRRADVRWRNDTKQRFRETYDYWDKHFAKVNVEEFYMLADVMSRLQVANQLENLHDHDLTHNVQYLIAKTLEVSLRKSKIDLHESFVKAIWYHAGSDGRKLAVITLNWDILIDQAADVVFGSRRLNIGLDRVFDRHFTQVPRNEDGFPLFKMHGSLNWWFCTACQGLRYKSDEKDVLDYWEGIAPECAASDCKSPGSKLVPIMIPPTNQKLENSPSSYITQRVWLEARKRLRDCQSLVLIGYSFPPTDVQFKMFLLEALSENPPLTITVLSNRKVGSERQRFEDNYWAVFGNLPDRVQLSFRYEGFERWVADGCGGR